MTHLEKLEKVLELMKEAEELVNELVNDSDSSLLITATPFKSLSSNEDIIEECGNNWEDNDAE